MEKITNFKKIEDYLLDKGYCYHKDTLLNEANEPISSTIYLIKDRQVPISIEESEANLGFLSCFVSVKNELIEGLTAGDVANLIEELENSN